MIESLRKLWRARQTTHSARYRLGQHDSSNAARFHFETGHRASAYIVAGEGFSLNGWIAGTDESVTGLRVSAVHARRRELALIEQFNHRPDISERYPALKIAVHAGFSIDLSTLPELLQGNDFALELEVRANDNWCKLTTITMVRDEYVNPSVFIVGSPRSGTSIVGNSIRRTLCANHGYGEGHVLPLSSVITQAVTDYHNESGASVIPEMMLYDVNPILLNEQMLSVLKKQYMTLIEDNYIVDKTPGGPMIRNLPHIQKLWPDARIIFVKRRGIENVASRLRKFPQVGFESHCRQWKNCMNAWIQVREGLHHTIEIDQYDVQTKPTETAAMLADFLSLTEPQERYLTARFVADRPEQTGKNTSPPALDFKKIDWTDEEKSVFQEHCANDLEKWGYSEDGSYYHQATG